MTNKKDRLLKLLEEFDEVDSVVEPLEEKVTFFQTVKRKFNEFVKVDLDNSDGLMEDDLYNGDNLDSRTDGLDGSPYTHTGVYYEFSVGERRNRFINKRRR